MSSMGQASGASCSWAARPIFTQGGLYGSPSTTWPTVTAEPVHPGGNTSRSEYHALKPEDSLYSLHHGARLASPWPGSLAHAPQSCLTHIDDI